MTDRIVAALSRRASLLTLGAAGTVAAFAPLTADARKKKNRNKNQNKKVNKKARQKCQNQIEQCNDLVIAQCGEENEECIAEGLVCCEFLSDCNFTGFLGCLTSG